MARNPLIRSAAEESAPDTRVPPPRVPEAAHSSGPLFDGVGDLRIAATVAPGVPAAVEYIPQDHERERLIACINAGINVCLVGPPGCGKTTLVRSVCAELGRPLVPFQCGRGVTLDHIIGFRDLAQEEGATVTNVVPGPLMRAMVHGAVFYPDEIDTLDDGVGQHLGGAMDFRRELAPPEWRGVILKGAPGFVVVSSTNADYIRDGRNIPDHIRDRFVFVRMDYLPPAREASLVVRTTGVKADIADRMVEVAKRLREARKKPTAAGATFKSHVSTRTLIDWAKLVVGGLSAREAGAVALVEKIPLAYPKDEALARDTLDAVFPAEAKNLRGAQDPDKVQGT